MSQFPDDDKPLIAFLKEYRPTPPPATLNLEMQLMAQVRGNAWVGKRRFYRLMGFFSTMIATSLFLAWGISRLSPPSPSIATNPEELDAFLVDSWNGTVWESSTAFSPHSTASQWLLLGDTEH